jgi:hypothetical protein
MRKTINIMRWALTEKQLTVWNRPKRTRACKSPTKRIYRYVQHFLHRGISIHVGHHIGRSLFGGASTFERRQQAVILSSISILCSLQRSKVFSLQTSDIAHRRDKKNENCGTFLSSQGDGIFHCALFLAFLTDRVIRLFLDITQIQFCLNEERSKHKRMQQSRNDFQAF